MNPKAPAPWLPRMPGRPLSREQETLLAFVFYCHLRRQLRRLDGPIAEDAATVFLWAYTYCGFKFFDRQTFVWMVEPALPPERAQRVLDQMVDLLYLRPRAGSGMLTWTRWRVEFAKSMAGDRVIEEMFEGDVDRTVQALDAFEGRMAEARVAIAAFWTSPQPSPRTPAPKLRLVRPDE